MDDEDEEPLVIPTQPEEEIFLSAQQKEREKEARELHYNVGYPGDKDLCKALENGNLAKVKAPTEKPSASPPAEKIGDNVHIDIILFPSSVGDNNHILFKVRLRHRNFYSYQVDTSTDQSRDVIIGIYHKRGHKISHFTIDNEKST